MSSLLKKVKDLITAFENDEISFDDTKKSIFDLTGKKITKYDLHNYWRSTDLNNYVHRLIEDPIIDWKDINDEKALILINGILDNIGNDIIFDVNSEALEKRYSKPSGTLSDWIFQDDVSNSSELLNLLKQDTTLLL